MAKTTTKVRLDFEVTTDRYHVVVIQGNIPMIEFGSNKVARVGSVLSEKDVVQLGRVAELRITRYTL